MQHIAKPFKKNTHQLNHQKVSKERQLALSSGFCFCMYRISKEVKVKSAYEPLIVAHQHSTLVSVT